ncbi:winged helix-turn-helix domain-containing protein [Bacillus sp. JJ1127]|uniref:ArsR/SmtB family transcription factor n=1 Tax=Bacillus sp. JJ1127 TaxID=3122952 RepID=UPI003000E294
MNITELALYKLLCDPKRQSILHYAAERPITVKELAEKLNEKQSRLYYHVKKLEEAGVLEVVETKAIGNLTEKYYQAKNTVYTLSDNLQKEHSDEIISHTRHIIETGLKKIHLNMKDDVNEEPAFLGTMYENQTEEEWAETCDNITKQLKPSQDTDTVNSVSPSSKKAKSSKTNTYAYVIMSYRIDD